MSKGHADRWLEISQRPAEAQPETVVAKGNVDQAGEHPTPQSQRLVRRSVGRRRGPHGGRVLLFEGHPSRDARKKPREERKPQPHHDEPPRSHGGDGDPGAQVVPSVCSIDQTDVIRTRAPLPSTRAWHARRCPGFAFSRISLASASVGAANPRSSNTSTAHSPQ